MGVPTFYRWLHDRYGRSIRDYREISNASFDELAPEWPPNPNGFEVDCLYLDFNQIVHQATHPPDRPAPPDQKSRLQAVCRCLDRLVLAARPRRMLVIALDGVAPRAKMNQQRSRRFIAAQERGAEAAAQLRLATTWEREPHAEHWDHNAITPGTEFMCELDEALRYHVARRVASCPAFARLRIVLSGASVPGEGEHKIVSIIREQRAQPNYDPDTVHLL